MVGFFMSKSNADLALASSSEYPKHLWKIEDVAAFFGVSVGTVYQWNSRLKHSADPLPVIRLSRRCLRFDPDEVKKWADRRNNHLNGGAQ